MNNGDSKGTLAIITGADGGMGSIQTLALARAGFHVIMACYDVQNAETVRESVVRSSQNSCVDIMQMNLADLSCVRDFAMRVRQIGKPIDILMNNAGTLQTHRHYTSDELEWTVSVNYVGPYLLTRLLIPNMHRGSRIVNMSSCSYLIGKITYPHFFREGRKGIWQRVLVYSNTKKALTMFSLYLAERLKGRGITVNVADPGIVDTDIIRMHNFIDYLTDLFYRRLINSPAQGAQTAIDLMLDRRFEGATGLYCKNSEPRELGRGMKDKDRLKELWEKTEEIAGRWL